MAATALLLANDPVYRMKWAFQGESVRVEIRSAAMTDFQVHWTVGADKGPSKPRVASERVFRQARVYTQGFPLE